MRRGDEQTYNHIGRWMLTQRIEVVMPSLAALLSGSRSDPGGNEDPFLRAVLVNEITELSVLLYTRKQVSTTKVKDKNITPG